MIDRHSESAEARAARHEASIARSTSFTRSGKTALPSSILVDANGLPSVEANIYVGDIGASEAVPATSPIEVEERIGQGDGRDIDIRFPCSKSLLASYVRAAERYGVAVAMSVKSVDDRVPPDGPVYQRALAIMKESRGLSWVDCIAQVDDEASAWGAAGDVIAQAKSRGPQ
ncbi:hypothetical protein WCQ02_40425 [Paraburkholderia tropica]|uniref:hypothetical protein n=1 Tax=Paraburkholderia tropica TaxID=92647 RepID=UPI0030176C24